MAERKKKQNSRNVIISLNVDEIVFAAEVAVRGLATNIIRDAAHSLPGIVPKIIIFECVILIPW